jgi:uncharacterized protein (DUF4415 family)
MVKPRKTPDNSGFLSTFWHFNPPQTESASAFMRCKRKIATDLRGRGRPWPARKVPIMFRLDPDLVAQLRASGPGYQTRVNALLREAVLGSGNVSRAWRLRASSAGRIAAHPMTARKAAKAPAVMKRKKSKTPGSAKKKGHARPARRKAGVRRRHAQ